MVGALKDESRALCFSVAEDTLERVSALCADDWVSYFSISTEWSEPGGRPWNKVSRLGDEDR